MVVIKLLFLAVSREPAFKASCGLERGGRWHGVRELVPHEDPEQARSSELTAGSA